MEVTFLGTGSGAPTRQRNVSAIALQLPQRAEWWLFDCGEGTQHQLLRAPHLRLSQLTRIHITHVHGDHLFGLPGLLASRALAMGGSTPVHIHAPESVEGWLRTTLRVSLMRYGFPVHFVPVREGVVHADADFTTTAVPVRHRVEAWAFAIREHDQPGRFDIEGARAMGIPEGPVYGRLKRGEIVTLDDGRRIDGRTLVGADRPGRKVVFSGDTAWSRELVELATDADLLVHEATYGEGDTLLADRAGHSTAAGAARVASEARARSLVLTHFSSRYDGVAGGGVDDLTAEARTIFPAVRAAHDLLRVKVARQEGSASASDTVASASAVSTNPL
ncbi:MAG: ribonuclease Z [Armatimonadota bacterium]